MRGTKVDWQSGLISLMIFSKKRKIKTEDNVLSEIIRVLNVASSCAIDDGYDLLDTLALFGE